MKVRATTFLLMLLTLSSCRESPRSVIEGEWKYTKRYGDSGRHDVVTFVYKQDRTMTVLFPDGDLIRATYEFDSTTKPAILTVAIKNDNQPDSDPQHLRWAVEVVSDNMLRLDDQKGEDNSLTVLERRSTKNSP